VTFHLCFVLVHHYEPIHRQVSLDDDTIHIVNLFACLDNRRHEVIPTLIRLADNRKHRAAFNSCPMIISKPFLVINHPGFDLLLPLYSEIDACCMFAAASLQK